MEINLAVNMQERPDLCIGCALVVAFLIAGIFALARFAVNKAFDRWAAARNSARKESEE